MQVLHCDFSLTSGNTLCVSGEKEWGYYCYISRYLGQRKKKIMITIRLIEQKAIVTYFW